MKIKMGAILCKIAVQKGLKLQLVSFAIVLQGSCTKLVYDSTAGFFSRQQSEKRTESTDERPVPVPFSAPIKPPNSNFGQITFEIDENVFPETVRGYVSGLQNVVKVEWSQGKSFVIDPVPPGTQDLFIFAYSRSPSQARELPASKISNSKSSSDSDAFEVGLKITGLVVEKGTTIQLGRLNLGQLHEVEGSVSLAGAQVPTDIQVRIEGTEFSTFTDAAGHYRFTGIPRGLHSLRFSKFGYGDGRLEEVELGAKVQMNLPPITLVRRQNKDAFATFNTVDFIIDSPVVEVVLGAPDEAKYMQISESEDFQEALIKPLQTTFAFEFKNEGQKQLFVKFLDSSGAELRAQASSVVQTRPITFYRFIVNGNPVALTQPGTLLEEPVANMSIKIPPEATNMKLWDQNKPEPEWAPVSSQVSLRLAPEIGERKILAKFLNKKGAESKIFNVPFALSPINWVARFFTGTCLKKSSCEKTSLVAAAVHEDGAAIGLMSRGEISLFKVWDTGEEIVSIDSNEAEGTCTNSGQQRPLFFQATGNRSVAACILAKDAELQQYSGIKILSYAENLDLIHSIKKSFQSAISVSNFVMSHLIVTDSGYQIIASQTANLQAKVKANAEKPAFMSFPGDSVNIQGHGTLIYTLSESGNFSWKKLIENFSLLDIKVSRATANNEEELVLLGNLVSSDKVETWIVVMSQRGTELWRKRLSDLLLSDEVAYEMRIEQARGNSLAKIEVHSAQKIDETVRLRLDQVSSSELITASFFVPSAQLEGRLYALKALEDSLLLRHGVYLSKVSRQETPPAQRLIWSHRLGANQEGNLEASLNNVQKALIGTSQPLKSKIPDMIYLYENEIDAVNVIKLRNW